MADPNELDAWVEAQIRRESQWPSWDDHKRALTLLQEHRTVLRRMIHWIDGDVHGTAEREWGALVQEARDLLAGEVKDG